MIANITKPNPTTAILTFRSGMQLEISAWIPGKYKRSGKLERYYEDSWRTDLNLVTGPEGTDYPTLAAFSDQNNGIKAVAHILLCLGITNDHCEVEQTVEAICEARDAALAEARAFNAKLVKKTAA